jgi:hypothetical protein
MARGMAAVIGVAFCQDAIGMYTDSDKCSHRLFTVSRSCGSPIPENDALKLMKIVIKRHGNLSAQFDEHGLAVEFHDYANSDDREASADQLRVILSKQLEHHSYEVKQSISNSTLLGEAEYEEAIQQAGLQYLATVIKMTRLYDTLYNRY